MVNLAHPGIDERQIEVELALMRTLRHPSVVACYGAALVAGGATVGGGDGRELWLAQEFMENGPLEDHIKNEVGLLGLPVGRCRCL